MDYPLKLTFKLFSFAPQISVVDASGKPVFYVRQKLFKLKEDITLFADEQRQIPLYSIKADRIIDFSARYHFKDQNGNELGSVKRRGMRSLWTAHYDISPAHTETPAITIREENPWVKVADALFAEIPILGMFTGYVFNPKYLVARTDGTVVMRLEKVPAFLSRIFTIIQVNQMSEDEEKQAVLSLLMMLLLERNRG
ncbi:hypothetical protein BST81_16395 [Leptolyngbya sp. 'hensonii']|uniref:hypothetical protein n=1 Tax=Leptolyngbya sp. 'hensonii' TaxID=1922337 RepID=UPI0009500039|nr:hypothetical protein [Leptolyngbya sp. 'hensonii']OLP17379.1 hypothetical protein BST81_16395 [Leptolyngbya sp. 'hensonii']